MAAISQPVIIWRRCSDTPDRPANHAAVNKATLVPLDHLVIQEMMVLLVRTVLRVVLARMPTLVTRKLRYPNSAHAKLALANQVLVDPLDNPVNLEMLEALETTVLPAPLDNQEHPAHKVHPVEQDPKDPQEPLDSRPTEDPDQLEPLELLAHKDPPDQTDSPVHPVLVLKDLPAHKVRPDQLVSQEAMADLDPLAHLEALVALALATTARHLDWLLDTRHKAAGRGLDTASFCNISGFLRATLYHFVLFSSFY